jgi:hypothetical protein
MDEKNKQQNGAGDANQHGNGCMCGTCAPGKMGMGNCGCAHCGWHGHHGALIILRWLLALIILGMVFTLGEHVGEFKANYMEGGARIEGRMYGSPMMMYGQNGMMMGGSSRGMMAGMSTTSQQ